MVTSDFRVISRNDSFAHEEYDYNPYYMTNSVIVESAIGQIRYHVLTNVFLVQTKTLSYQVRLKRIPETRDPPKQTSSTQCMSQIHTFLYPASSSLKNISVELSQ